MKSKVIIFLIFVALGNCFLTYGQSVENVPNSISIVSKAPISYRVNVTSNKLHGYYKKKYDLTIYGDSLIMAFRADCDKDDDWSGATPGGTTQTGNSFETSYHIEFNPHILYGTVLPANQRGQNHFDGLMRNGAGTGDLTMTYKVDKNNKVVDSIIGVVFDHGPQNQPGESSVAVCKKFGISLDSNQFLYIIYPRSSKYVKQVIGLKSNGKDLKRKPTNTDFWTAFKMMSRESSATDIQVKQKSLLDLLLTIKIINEFDHATAQEKKEGLLCPKNNDRNLNQ